MKGKDADDGKKRIRSPKYPSINLEEALKRARSFWNQEKKNTVPVAVAVKHWGYQAKSSGGPKAVSALINFGLMGDKGASEDRKVHLSDQAIRIILDTRPESQERDQLIKEAALKPKIYQEVLAAYPSGLPSNDTLRHFLIFDKEFNVDSVDGFIKDFRATLAFAKLGDSGNISGLEAAKEENRSFKVGDLVQWESDGVLQFEVPKKVRAVQDHEGQAWIFVDGSETGIPAKEVTLSQSGVTADSKPAVPPTLPEARQSQEKEWLRGSLSSETSYRLYVSGDLGPKEIGKLIKLLEAQKAVLSDDEEEN